MRYVYRFGAAFLTAGMAPDNLAIDEKGCRVAPAKLLPQQRSNFAEIFEVMAVTTKASSRRGSAAPRFVADVKTRPEIKLGICGEHGGDPASIAFCEKVGLDYVSASPYPIPAARLAAAQAALCKNT